MQQCFFLLLTVLLPLSSVVAESVERISALGGRAKVNASGQIVDINLRGSWVNDTDLIAIGRLPELQRLDLSHTRITDEGLLRLKSTSKIVDLNLFYAEQITDQGMAAIRNWQNLKRLNVRGTRISDGTLELISRMPQLEALDIANTQISDKGYDYLITLVNLKELSLGRDGLSDNAIKALRLLPTLTFLDLSGPTRRNRRSMSDTVVRAIADLRELETLRLGYSGLSDQGVVQLSRLHHLKKLSLVGCQAVGDAVADTIIGWKSLESIDLQDTALTAAAIDSIRRARDDLRILANPAAPESTSASEQTTP